jgi:hypothetical protein
MNANSRNHQFAVVDGIVKRFLNENGDVYGSATLSYVHASGGRKLTDSYGH